MILQVSSARQPTGPFLHTRAALTASGAEFIQLEMWACPAFVLGNVGEHFTKAKENILPK
jgi:hypothetical protein